MIESSSAAFIAGYQAVKNGWIVRELSVAEIEKYYHEHRKHSVSFRNGMLDALENDDWRYRRTIDRCQVRLAI